MVPQMGKNEEMKVCKRINTEKDLITASKKYGMEESAMWDLMKTHNFKTHTKMM